MNLKQTYRMDGYGRPFVITIPAHASTPTDDLLRNAEDAVRPLREKAPIGLRISIGYAGEPGTSAPSILLTGDVPANKPDLWNSSGTVMNELVKIAKEVAPYLPAHLLAEKKSSIRIQYGEQDVYLGREPAKVEA